MDLTYDMNSSMNFNPAGNADDINDVYTSNSECETNLKIVSSALSI